MSKPTYLMIIVSLAAIVIVAPPLSTSAQQGSDQLQLTAGDEAPPDGVAPPTAGDETPPDSNGPPTADAPSKGEVLEEPTAESAPPPAEPLHGFYYYRPGDLNGVRYETSGECLQASQQAGNVGICVIK